MINYGKGAKRTIVKDKNVFYSKIVDDEDNVSFIKLYKPDEFMEKSISVSEGLDTLLKYSEFTTVQNMHLNMQLILGYYADMIRLKESSAVFIRNSDPHSAKVIQTAMAKIESKFNTTTQLYAQTCREHPQCEYNYEPDIFEIPGITEKILNGDEQIKGKYWSEIRSNEEGYKKLMIRGLLSGREVLDVTELSRLNNGFKQENELKEKFSNSENKNTSTL